jgi:hypothetical protein
MFGSEAVGCVSSLTLCQACKTLFDVVSSMETGVALLF